MNIKLEMCIFRELGKEIAYPDIYKDSYAIFTYTALRSICKSNVTLHTTIQGIYQALSDAEPSKPEIKAIKESLKLLVDNELISCKKKGTTYSITPLSDFEIYGNNYYFTIPLEYIKSIMSCHSGIKLLHHYLLLCSTINVFNKVGNHAIRYFADALNVRDNTISDQRKKFVELGIISFSEQRSRKLDSSEFANIPKLYTMPNNSDLLGDACEVQLEKEQKKLVKAKKKAKKIVYDEIDDRREQKKIKNEIEKKEKVLEEDSELFPF